MCFVRNKKNDAYFQAAQIYSPRRDTSKSSPIRSIFNSDLSLTKTEVLSKFHPNRFIFTRVIMITKTGLPDWAISSVLGYFARPFRYAKSELALKRELGYCCY